MTQYVTTEKSDSYELEGELWTRGRNVLVLLLLVSWLASAAGLLVDAKQFSQSYLVAFIYFIAIGLGALFS